MDLTHGKYSILNWIAILLQHRTFDLSSNISKLAKEYLIKNFYINVNDYDIVIGYRADDSYFTFARDFINNSISVRQLNAAMALGSLSIQVVIISEKAFNKLCFEGFEVADRVEYFAKRKTRDENARKNYLTGNLRKQSLENDLFVIDIIRREIKNGDTII